MKNITPISTPVPDMPGHDALFREWLTEYYCEYIDPLWVSPEAYQELSSFDTCTLWGYTSTALHDDFTDYLNTGDPWEGYEEMTEYQDPSFNYAPLWFTICKEL